MEEATTAKKKPIFMISIQIEDQEEVLLEVCDKENYE